MTTQWSDRITVSQDVLLQELDGEAVILDMKSEYYYGLDDVGLRMWQLMTQDGDLEAVVTQFLVEYDVDEATVRQDLATLVEHLTRINLIQVAPQADTDIPVAP